MRQVQSKRHLAIQTSTERRHRAPCIDLLRRIAVYYRPTLHCISENFTTFSFALYVMSCHVAVPSSTTLATTRCQSNRLSEALMSSVGLILSFRDSHKLSTYFSLWRPFAFLPSIFPNTTKFSRPCFLNSCPRKASCRWRILFISVRCTPAF